jgi:hypothetical protein
MNFHVLNRGNARDQIFTDDAASASFEVYAPGQSHDLTDEDWRMDGVLTKKERETVQPSVVRGRPSGSESWQEATAKQLGLDSTFPPRGRPKNTIDDSKSKFIGLIPV